MCDIRYKSFASDRDSNGTGGDFAALVATEYQGLLGLAFALTGSWSAAEDIVQEAFVRGHQRWSKVSAYDRPGAWLRRVVINPALSARRRLSREALAYLRLANTRADDPGGGVEGDLEFWRTVRCLPRRQAEVVALYYWEDLSVTEVAAILEIREGTVSALLHQGRRRVASALGVEAPDD